MLERHIGKNNTLQRQCTPTHHTRVTPASPPLLPISCHTCELCVFTQNECLFAFFLLLWQKRVALHFNQPRLCVTFIGDRYKSAPTSVGCILLLWGLPAFLVTVLGPLWCISVYRQPLQIRSLLSPVVPTYNVVLMLYFNMNCVPFFFLYIYI